MLSRNYLFTNRIEWYKCINKSWQKITITWYDIKNDQPTLLHFRAYVDIAFSRWDIATDVYKVV